MKKFVYNLIKFSLVFLVIPASIFIVDPYDYYEFPLKMDIDRMQLFRRSNVADWAMVEVDKIDQSLKTDVVMCAIGDSRSRILISGGHQAGWSTRICGVDLDVLDLSFGGANLDESFSFLEKEIKNLESLETIIVSVSIDRLLLASHEVNRVSASVFNAPLTGIKYLTDINLLNNIFSNREKILYDTAEHKQKNGKQLESVKTQNDKIRESKTDPEQIKWRNRIRAYKRDKFIESQNEKNRTTPSDKNKMGQDDKVRQSFLRKFRVGSRSLFHENLNILKSQLLSFSDTYEVIILIPTYDDILYDSIMKNHGEDYEYYVRKLKELSYSVINLQDISDQFSFGDPVHGSFLNGSLLYKIKHKRTALNK